MIQIEELNVRYGGIHALKGISFEVPDNSIVTLLGANGAGNGNSFGNRYPKAIGGCFNGFN